MNNKTNQYCFRELITKCFICDINILGIYPPTSLAVYPFRHPCKPYQSQKSSAVPAL